MRDYIDIYKTGMLDKKIERFYKRLESCDLCPRKCKVNRHEYEKGVCKTGTKAVIASYGPHFREEEPLVGKYGSGTIFFSNCNLLCNFCQNSDISYEGKGFEVDDIQLADIMIDLQNRNCHNINFVTPTHVVPQILSALKTAIEKGLNIPLIYNTSAYDSIETIKTLSGVIDIYMPDFKFWNPKYSKITCNVNDYTEIAKEVVKEMFRQKGDLTVNKAGIAVKGLLIRHLVMPNDFSGTKDVLNFIYNEISKDSYVNIMPQYRPAGIAYDIKEISKSLNYDEYLNAVEYAEKIGLKT